MTAQKIDMFTGPYAFLSNFHPATIHYEGIVYPSVEHAYQAAKTASPFLRQSIARCSTPGEAKRLGRRLTLRADWEDVKVAVMLQLLEEKFKDPVLKDALCRTYPAPITEGNWWGDTFWGVCSGEGSNVLGKLLMYLRHRLCFTSHTEVVDA